MSRSAGLAARALQLRRSAWERLGPGAMLELHVVTAIRTVHVAVIHVSSAKRTLVTAARDEPEVERRHPNHREPDEYLLHRTVLRDSFLERIFQRADIYMMTFRHHDQECAQLGVAE